MFRFEVTSIETHGALISETRQLNHCGTAEYQLELDLLKKAKQ